VSELVLEDVTAGRWLVALATARSPALRAILSTSAAHLLLLDRLSRDLLERDRLLRRP